MQFFLTGLESETHTITVPYPVTRQHLHEAIANVTHVPPHEQNLGSMYNHTDVHNTDILYIDKGTTLHLLVNLKGGSGNQRPQKSGAKNAQPTTHLLQLLIYVNGPEAQRTPLLVRPIDKFSQIKELLQERIAIEPTAQTLFLKEDQLGDDLYVKDYNITKGTTLHLLRTLLPTTCDLHGKKRDKAYLKQQFDTATASWIWVYRSGATCYTEQSNRPATTTAGTTATQQKEAPRAKHTTYRGTHPPRETTAAETPPGIPRQPLPPGTSHLLDIGTRVLVRYSDGLEYAATIQGSDGKGHIITFDGYEHEGSHRITSENIKLLPESHTPSVYDPPPTTRYILCATHKSLLSEPNLQL